MKVHVVRTDELDDSLKARWRGLQSSDRAFASPYFCPEFTEAVGVVREDVRVGIMESAGRVIGFFPFHRRRFGFARPVGLGISDCHGVISARDAEWTAADLLAQCKLIRWEFDHLIASQTQFGAHFSSTEPSPIIDVSSGVAEYLKRRTALGDSELKNIFRRFRKLRRERGPFRFVADDRDDAAVERLFVLKSAQYRAARTFDCFALGWIRDLIRGLREIQQPSFSGLLSTLYVGDTPTALHFGMRSATVWHWWFPCFDRAFARYSPGLLLLWELINEAAANGIHYIDLGKNLQRYKRGLMTGAIDVAQGSVERSSVCARAINACRSIATIDARGPLRPLLRIPAGIVRRISRNLRYS